MKYLVFASILAGLISAGLLAPSFGSVRPAQSITISDILQAHRVSRESTDLSRCYAVAHKVMPFESTSDGTGHNFLAQTVWLFAEGGRLRYGNVRLIEDATVTESYLFDGASYHRSVTGLKEPVNTTGDIGDSDSRLTLQRISQFGLLPFLRQLADPRTEATYLGRTASGNEMLKVQTTSDSWIFYSNESGLIQRIEIGSSSFVFSDYKSVKGLELPFNERVYNSHGLFYELAFIRIDPKPAVDKDSFNQPDPFKQVGR